MTWIGLSEAKAQLDKTSNVDNAEVLRFAAAACGIVEDLKGHVEPTTITETRPALLDRSPTSPGAGYSYRWFVELTETPVLSVQSVSAVRGSVVSPVTGAEPIGSLLRGVPGPGAYRVTYTAGRAEIPENFRLAALELVTHLWRGSQLNANGGRPQLNGEQMAVVPGNASALPYRVRELLGVYGAVVSDHVVIA